MELRRHFDLRKVFVTVYALMAFGYLAYGLQPVDAARYDVSGALAIPSIDLDTDVTSLEITNGKLETPDSIVGSFSMADNKTLLIGHYSEVFNDLDDVQLDDEIWYNGDSYRVVRMEIREKSTISMNKVLETSELETLVIMTCAGQMLENGDATHRLMVTAVKQ